MHVQDFTALQARLLLLCRQAVTYVFHAGAGSDANTCQPAVSAAQLEAFPTASTQGCLSEPFTSLAHLRAILWLLHI